MKKHMNKVGLVISLAWLTSGAWSQTQSYELNMRATEVPMFQQNIGSPAVQSITEYAGVDLEFSLTDFTATGTLAGSSVTVGSDWGASTNASLPVGLGALGGPFSYSFVPSFSIDLTSVGGPNFSILNNPIGYDIDLSGGVDFSFGMRHELDTGWFDIQIPLQIDITIEEFDRGKIARIQLDSSFTSPPQLNPSNPSVDKTLFLSGGVHGQGEFNLYTGPFGDGQYDYELFDFELGDTLDLVTTGTDHIGGWGLLVNPESATCEDGFYDYNLTLEGVNYSGQSNLLWKSYPALACLGAEVPGIVDSMDGDELLIQLNESVYAGQWSTTGDAMQFWLPVKKLEAVLSRPNNDLTQIETDMSTGEMRATSTAFSHPHMQLNHSLHKWVRGKYFKKCRNALNPFAPTPPSGSTSSPSDCKKFAALDLMNTHSSLLLKLFRDAVGRVSVQGFLDNLSSISTQFGGDSYDEEGSWTGDGYGMGNWDIWFEYDLLDFETHINLENQLDAHFTPEMRVRLKFPEPVQYRLTEIEDWQIGEVVDMPLEGSFEIQTNCDDYQLALVPEFYIVEEDNMLNEGKDVYSIDLELEALQFNAGMTELPIIPSFTFDFPCSGSVGEFFESAGNCIASIAAPIANTVCTAVCYLPGVCTTLGGCVDPCLGVLGGCEVCTGTTGGQGSSACSNCVTALTCFQDSYECTLCDYGFPGLIIPEFDLADVLGSTTVNDFGNKVLGFNEVWTIAEFSDSYMSKHWSVDGFTAVEPNSLEEIFLPDSTVKSANPFQVNDVFVKQAAASPKSTTALLQFDAEGGSPPLIASSTSFVNDRNVMVQLDHNKRAVVPSGRYREFVLSDASGCISDISTGSIEGLESSLAVPYVRSHVFNYCSDVDQDGCNDCTNGDFDPSNDGLDSDGDGICNVGDPDDDNDGVIDGDDIDTTDPYLCGDSDGDGCDDCSSGTFDPANDGIDNDGDGQCDSSDNDLDGDGLENALDDYPGDSSLCGSHDGDSCDDCISGTYNPLNDGTDTDGDGLCDVSDEDDDNDGRLDIEDSAQLDPTICSDTDQDGCDDCSSGQYAPNNDGTDTDGEGLCDTSDPDQDNDGRLNGEDTHPLSSINCADTDNDGCDDCVSGSYNPTNDGADFDGDGLCDFGDDDIDGDDVSNDDDVDDNNPLVCRDDDEDTCDDCSEDEQLDSDNDGICNAGDYDDDNDGVLDVLDAEPFNQYVCGDFDNDGGDDCISGSYNPFNDGLDTDSDGICDTHDLDKDGDNVPAVAVLEGFSDSDDMNENVCLDWDQDGCDDCSSSGTFDLLDDGDNADGDLFCDTGDNCSNLVALNWDYEGNTACVYTPELSNVSESGLYDYDDDNGDDNWTLGATVSNYGAADITAVGVKYGLSSELLGADSIGVDYSVDEFNIALHGLGIETTYYFSIFASHIWGTGWSEILTFTTPPSGE
jgi:hypothetical protein